MMTHKVVVLDGKTFRLNPAVCHPYNADFDGDEMNLHVPQNEEARAEAEILMAVETQMISPRYGLSVIGCVQDGISGNYLLTKESEFTREDAVQLLANAGVTDFSELPAKKNLAGKEIFSVLIPGDFSFTGRSKSCPTKSKPCAECPKWKGERCEIDANVAIKDGKLISGVMDSANLGHGSGLMLRNLHKKYGQYATIDILNKISKLGVYTLLNKGFSVGLADTDLPENAVKKIQGMLNNAEEEVSRLIDSYHKKELEAFPGKTMLETLELKILGVLNRARNETGDVVAANASTKTGAYVMATSGSRGTTINLAQMAACVGQQAMRGKRIDVGFTERSLSTFRKNDLSPSARGFIRHGFKKGMNPDEFFFASMTGRDSLMDTALRTPKSGYLYRRLANSLQDLKVEYDITVRDASRRIIQFVYGEDGMDVSRSEGGKIDVRRIIEEVVKAK